MMLGPGWERPPSVGDAVSSAVSIPGHSASYGAQAATHCKSDVLHDLLYIDTEHAQGSPASAHAAAVKRSSDGKNQM